MINTDEKALICDLAETYRIYDYRSLPLQTVATLSVGLRANSRIKMKMSGIDMEPDIYLLSAIVDRLSILLWRQTEDGIKGKNPPSLILSKADKEDEIVGFNTVEEFENERNRILRGGL